MPRSGSILWILLGLLNLAAFLCFGIDKRRAKTGAWRIPERTLLLLSALGGSIGGFLGMILFRHKTRHWLFRFGLPALVILHLVGILYLTGTVR